MIPETPTFGARLRAASASVLASLAAGARRLEAWSARGSRLLLLGLIAIAVLVAGALAVAYEGRHAAAWIGGNDRPAHTRGVWHAKPQGKPFAKDGPSSVGKPEAPRPPSPPPPPPAP